MGPRCALCSGWRMVGWGGEDAQRLFPPVGAQVGAGRLLLGVGSWTAELVQHGLIPEGRAEGEGQHPLTTRRLCRASCPPGELRGPKRCPRRTCVSADTTSCSQPSHLFLLQPPGPRSRLLHVDVPSIQL